MWAFTLTLILSWIHGGLKLANTYRNADFPSVRLWTLTKTQTPLYPRDIRNVQTLTKLNTEISWWGHLALDEPWIHGLAKWSLVSHEHIHRQAWQGRGNKARGNVESVKRKKQSARDDTLHGLNISVSMRIFNLCITKPREVNSTVETWQNVFFCCYHWLRWKSWCIEKTKCNKGQWKQT